MINNNFTTAASQIDPSKIISKNIWALSIIRQEKSSPSDTANREHAFLLIEGIERNTVTNTPEVIMRNYSLYIDMDDNAKVPQDQSSREVKSIIIAKEKRGTPTEIKDWFQSKIEKGRNTYYLSWDITAGQAAELHINIQKDVASPPLYHIYGDRTSLGKINESKSDRPSMVHVDNCFTWARTKVNELSDPDIKIDYQLADFIGSAASRYIGPKDLALSYTDQLKKAVIGYTGCNLI